MTQPSPRRCSIPSVLGSKGSSFTSVPAMFIQAGPPCVDEKIHSSFLCFGLSLRMNEQPQPGRMCRLPTGRMVDGFFADSAARATHARLRARATPAMTTRFIDSLYAPDAPNNPRRAPHHFSLYLDRRAPVVGFMRLLGSQCCEPGVPK